MPEVDGKEFPYTPEGKQQAKAYAERTGKKVNPKNEPTTYEGGGMIQDDSPMHGRQRQWWGGTKPMNEPRQELLMEKGGEIPTQDATSRTQNYQIGGKIPGEEGFGINPNDMNSVQTDVAVTNPVNPKVPVPEYEEGGMVEDDEEDDVEEYREGGKVRRAKRKAKRKARRKARKERRALLKATGKRKRDIRRQARKGSKSKSAQEHYGTVGDRKATRKAIKDKLTKRRTEMLETYDTGGSYQYGDTTYRKPKYRKGGKIKGASKKEILKDKGESILTHPDDIKRIEKSKKKNKVGKYSVKQLQELARKRGQTVEQVKETMRKARARARGEN